MSGGVPGPSPVATEVADKAVLLCHPAADVLRLGQQVQVLIDIKVLLYSLQVP